ncbi:alpha/beta hydrolase [Spirosoma taeanense]|uniref:Alpha/beta hydrolase n=1 Tax=Spirosoma taeanense TaxID=2735870 RepID=A0A6M5YES1_9BACT|nr:alpha/beta hydrolase [Spirosoma taeanense]QJW92104.1 alpha/beta hydrolase [Spirosoma taeanense]
MKRLINGIHLNILEQGNGPLTLIFLHYFGGSALEWQVIMSHFSAQYRCIAVDLRGHGDSEAPASGYSVDDMADDVICVVQELAIQDFILVGHSMSGKVALAVAAGTPNHGSPAGLQSLLLVSPSPPVPEPIPDDERQMLLTNHGQRKAAKKMLKNITAISVSQAISEQIIADDLRTSESAWTAWLTAGSKEDITSRMAAIAIPVHITVGSKDGALPPDVQTHMVLPYLTDVTLEQMQGAGHLLPWEVPAELAAFIAKKIGV